jgi:PAS domain S-box-containing protein
MLSTTLTLTAPLIAAAATAGGVACYAWAQRHVPGAVALCGLMLAVAWWSTGYAFELSGSSLSAQLTWAKIEYLGIVLLPPAWLVFALHYTGRERWLTGRFGVAVMAVPLVTLGLVWTNEFHGLIWSRVTLSMDGPIPALELVHGPWFWIHVATSYALLATGSALVMLALVRSQRLFQRQGMALLVAVLVPWLANALFLAGLVPEPRVDQTPVAFTISGLAIAWSLMRDRFLDLVPVARAAVFENMSDGVLVLDARDRVLDVNPAAARAFGRRPAHIVGRALREVLAGQAELVERCRNMPEAREEISFGQGADQRSFDLRISPIMRGGRPVARLAVFRDITDRKRAEDRLRRSELRLAEAQRIAHLSSWEWDIPSNTVVWSEELYRMAGLEPAGFEATFEAFLERVHPEDRARVHERIAQAARDGQPFEIEYRLVRPGGNIRILHGRGAVVTDRQGRCIRMVGTAQDVTEQREAEERARQLEHEQVARAAAEAALRRRDEFLSVAAHELKTPVTSLRGYAQLLLRAVAAPVAAPEADARLRRGLATIDRESGKLNALVSQLLDVSRLDAGKLRIDPQPTDLTRLAADVVEAAQASTDRHTLVLEAPGPVRAWVDPLRLEQVLTNLVSNAVKYSPQGGPVVCQISQPTPERVRLAVRDRGLGIAPEKRARIFERFYRAHEDERVAVAGMGLGLYICRELIELHGGRIEAEFPSDGGSCFVLTLPAEPGSSSVLDRSTSDG